MVDIPSLRTSAGVFATFDHVISVSARAFLESLSGPDQAELLRALDILVANPHPDGVSKITLNGFPYQPGTIGATCGDFWIVYRFLNAATLAIATVYWKPDSPRRAGELYES